MNLLERVEATQKTIDQFFGQPFEWGVRDCAILAATHAENFGYETRLKEARNYKTAIGAKRALHELGVSDMEDLVDAYGFERIPPAMALPGDLCAIPGGEEGNEWSALGIFIDSGQHIMAFAMGECLKGPASVCTTAWRVA